MIPIELTIQGLYSYQKKQTINFRELTEAGLFGIFGGVGSGKSSILEAITFAIYGKTDRLNLSGDNRNYNMMNLKSDELLIDFTFETGKEQTAYRSIVKGRRNSKRFDDVKAPERTTLKMINNEWEPIELNELEKAIGLSYDNFKRTIIIPQGQFQEFLQLGNKDRTTMMKELFHLDKYEFYYKVVAVETKNNAKKQNIEGQMQQLGTVDPDQLNEYKNELTLLGSKLLQLNQNLTEDQKKEEELRGLLELTNNRNIADAEHNNLVDQKNYYTNLENKIINYELCVNTFKHLLDSLYNEKEKEKKRREIIEVDNNRLKEESERIKTLEEQLKILQPKYDKRDELKRKSEELNTLLKINELDKLVDDYTNKVEIGTDFLSEAIKNVDSFKKEQKSLELSLKELRDSMPDLSLLSSISLWYRDKINMENQLSETEKNIEKYKEQADKIEREKSELLTSSMFNNFLKTDYADPHEYLKHGVTELKKQLESAEEEEKHFVVKEQLKSFAKDLKDDTPCPLCGSLHHPDLFSSDDISEELYKIKDLKLSINKRIEMANSLSYELKMLESRQKDSMKVISDYVNDRKAIQLKIDEHLNAFKWSEYKRFEELEKAYEVARELKQRESEKEKALQNTANELAKQESNRDRAREKLELIKNDLTKNTTEINLLREQLHIISADQYDMVPEKDIESEKEQLNREYQEIQTEYSTKLEELHNLNRQTELLKGKLEVNRAELKNDLNVIVNLEEKIKTELVKSNYGTIDEVREILSEPIDVESGKVRINQYKNQLLQSKTTLQQLIKEIGDRVYDEKVHLEIKEKVSNLKVEIDQKNREQGKLEELIKSLERSIEMQNILAKDLEALEERAENIRTLKTLFKASGFVNYISSVYLQNLCNSANERFFQLTRQKLSLEITDDNNFQVRDFMNGGKVRSVKTLSGGQTFQASLSLALALADNIQKITESNQNFFFLDEGFGSLDKESLDIVFDTLKSLRKENRIVGVISHVEEMQQEIEVHLRIVNNEESGSIIYRSWEE